MIMLRFLLTLLLTCTSFASSARSEMQHLQFSGSLSQQVRGGEDVLLRRFEVTGLDSNGRIFFALLDDPQDGCPWPESFGISRQSDAHLTYQFDGNGYNILLPNLRIDLPEDVAFGSTWSEGDWRYEVVPGADEDESGLKLKLRATGRRGRRRDFTVDPATGVLRTARHDVFMGQGERFELVLTQTQSNSLSDEIAEKTAVVQEDLLSLQSSLNRRPDTQQAGLSVRQIGEASRRLDALEKNAAGTPLEATVQRIVRDVRRQEERLQDLRDKQTQMVGSKLPGFSLNLIGGGTVAAEQLRGKTVVLHFWDYSEKSLSEPYGQVAYLDFVYDKMKARGPVEVIGVATAIGLSNSGQSTPASRSIRKLMEFMNLSYPVGHDDGTLLKSLGDPRESGGKLPLWVVISPDGKIVHYHAGYYEIDRRLGLKELSTAIGAAMK